MEGDQTKQEHPQRISISTLPINIQSGDTDDQRISFRIGKSSVKDGLVTVVISPLFKEPCSPFDMINSFINSLKEVLLQVIAQLNQRTAKAGNAWMNSIFKRKKKADTEEQKVITLEDLLEDDLEYVVNIEEMLIEITIVLNRSVQLQETAYRKALVIMQRMVLCQKSSFNI